MSKDRPPSFQFYPRDFLADMVAHGIDRERAGRYWWACCCSWGNRDPGVASEDQWRRWMGYSEAQWEVDRVIVMPLFHLDEDGNWVQKRMVETRQEQRQRREWASAGGQTSVASARRERGRFVGRDTNTQPSHHQHPDQVDSNTNTKSTPTPTWEGVPTPASASASALEEESKTNPPTPRSRPRTARPEREPLGFGNFYQTYPRPDGRRAAAKAFEGALKRHPEYQPDDLLAAARAFAAQCQSEARDPHFICHPATWLNQDRFREFFDEEVADA